MADYTIKKGEHLTLKGTAVDDDGAAVTLTSGYTFVAKSKPYHSTADASGLSDVDSVNNSTRFSTSTNTVTGTIISSSESNTASPGLYYFGLWAINTSTSQEYPVKEGTVFIADSAVDTKS